jgi:formylglycine-generating enzyme required for sulfatase activity
MMKQQWIRMGLLFGSMLWLLPMQSAQAGEWTNSIGMTFVSIPAGSFYMGSCKLSDAQKEENKRRQFLGQPTTSAACPSGANSDNDANDSETPQHKVRVSAFQMGKYEVTLGQFKQYIAAMKRKSLVDDEFMKDNRYGDNAPVVHVRWYDANNFAEWLSKKEGKSYRLPSEAEWEYAARGGSRGKWSYSGNHGDYAWYDGNSRDHQHAVGQKRPNGFGLYDTAGNVWEWVQDNWHDNYRGAPSNGSVWGSGDSRYRVFRGGGWYGSAVYLRTAFRLFDEPDYRGDRYHSVGFRLLRQP